LFSISVNVNTIDDLTEIFERGISAKRHGNFHEALEILEECGRIAPTDNRIFGNRFRILIGLGKYEEALRNLFVLANYNQIDKLILQDPMAQAIASQFSSRFIWEKRTLYSASMFSNIKFNPTLINTAIKKHPQLIDFIYRADNLTFYIGHAFVGMNPQIICYNNIPQVNFLNLNSALLGQMKGQDLRGSQFDGLFLTLGFMVGHMNLKTNFNSKSDVVKYFMDKSNRINLNVSDYEKYV